jgi:hypothetical protein
VKRRTFHNKVLFSAQAQARCHRIGQTKDVKVYRLITRNSYEREMFDRASLKLGLDKAVLQSMRHDANPAKDKTTKEIATPGQCINQLSKKELEDLLKKGAYGAIMEDDNAAEDFCEEDIDQILQRRTQVISIEAGVKGGTFAKATFQTIGTRDDIALDDPDFWEKWAKKADVSLDDQSKNELIVEEPRRRKQTKRFGEQDMMEYSELETSDSDASETVEGGVPGQRQRQGKDGKRKKKAFRGKNQRNRRAINC